MRTITKSYNVYKFDELTEEAKEKAIQDYRENMDFSWQNEMVDTIRAIADAINCTYNYYSYDGISYSVSFEAYDFDDSLEGKRAWAFIENNFIEPNAKAKTYWLNKAIYCDGRKNWRRNSKIWRTIDNCPFTGYIADCCFSETWKEWKNNFSIGDKFHRGSTVKDFIEILESRLSKEWTEDNEYQYSDTGIIEVISCNDWEFLEDGTIY